MKECWNDIYDLFFLYDTCKDVSCVGSLLEYYEIDFSKVYQQYRLVDTTFDYAFLLGKYFVMIDIFVEEGDRGFSLKKKMEESFFLHKIEVARSHLRNKNLIYLAKAYGKDKEEVSISSLQEFLAYLQKNDRIEEVESEVLLICDKTGFRVVEESKTM